MKRLLIAVMVFTSFSVAAESVTCVSFDNTADSVEKWGNSVSNLSINGTNIYHAKSLGYDARIHSTTYIMDDFNGNNYLVDITDSGKVVGVMPKEKLMDIYNRYSGHVPEEIFENAVEVCPDAPLNYFKSGRKPLIKLNAEKAQERKRNQQIHDAQVAEQRRKQEAYLNRLYQQQQEEEAKEKAAVKKAAELPQW